MSDQHIHNKIHVTFAQLVGRMGFKLFSLVDFPQSPLSKELALNTHCLKGMEQLQFHLFCRLCLPSDMPDSDRTCWNHYPLSARSSTPACLRVRMMRSGAGRGKSVMSWSDCSQRRDVTSCRLGDLRLEDPQKRSQKSETMFATNGAPGIATNGGRTERGSWPYY